MFEEPQAKALANAIAIYLDDGASEPGGLAPTSLA